MDLFSKAQIMSQIGLFDIIPHQIDDVGLNTARLIAISLIFPSVQVSTDASITDFFEDDGGY